MPDKQSRELYLVERFLPILLKDRPYTLSQPLPPLPDIIIHVDGIIIGIETTALVLDEKVKQREAVQDAILSQAQMTFERRHNMPLQVTVSFVEAANWKQVGRQQIASFLTDLVVDCLPEAELLSTSNSHFNIIKDRLHHSHIRRIDVFYSHLLTVPCWSPSTGFVVPDAPVNLIQSIINRKGKNIQGYRSGCDQVWLLILEIGSPSSYYGGFEKLDEVKFISGFTRTLIGQIPNGKVVELLTQPTFDSPLSPP